jgi:hypothetical protein
MAVGRIIIGSLWQAKDRECPGIHETSELRENLLFEPIVDALPMPRMRRDRAIDVLEVRRGVSLGINFWQDHPETRRNPPILALFSALLIASSVLSFAQRRPSFGKRSESSVRSQSSALDHA